MGKMDVLKNKEFGMNDASQLTNEALALPLNERVRLAQQLWASLQESVDNEESVTLDVAKQRDEDLENGLEGIPHSEALARARKSLECP